MLDLEEGRIADLLLKGISGPAVESRLKPVQEKRILLNARLATARRRRAFVVDPLEVERLAEEWATGAREQLKLAKDDLAIFKALAKQLIRITLYAGAPPTIEVVISNSPWLNEGK